VIQKNTGARRAGLTAVTEGSFIIP